LSGKRAGARRVRGRRGRREAFGGLGDQLWREGSAGLADVVHEVDSLVVAGEAAVKEAVLPGQLPARSAAVAVDRETLRNGVRGAGVATGDPESGVGLGPETVRRPACDATIIPAVMGAAGVAGSGTLDTHAWLGDGARSARITSG